MNYYTPPLQPPPSEACCNPEQAAVWLDCLTELALTGDGDARRALPEAAQHFLAALRQSGVPR